MENLENNVVDVEVEGGATDTEEVKEKTLTQSQFDEAMIKRLNRERAKWEKEFTQKLEVEKQESEKIAKLNAEEKARYEFEKKVKGIEAREKELAKKELTIEVGTQLKELGISTKATRFVIGEDAETTHENIKEFEKLVEEIKEDLKRELLKGKTPKSSSSNGQSVTKEQFKKMNMLQRQELYLSNKDLYNKLTNN